MVGVTFDCGAKEEYIHVPIMNIGNAFKSMFDNRIFWRVVPHYGSILNL